MENFGKVFEQATGYSPFPWQDDLYRRYFSQGKFPPSCNLPTGLGKTSVVAIWLIALANQPEKVPRRMVYVVNRRTVVDQTTNEVEKLRANLRSAGLFVPLSRLCASPVEDDDAPLAISTLRGQFADNREWSADPSRPAVIVGTVDMIGSRLLFSGYGVGFKTKPLHAGFLAQDVLLVHDEAHLEPAFQKLLIAIQREQERCKEFGRFHVMELSATSREDRTEVRRETVFELTHSEINPPDVIPDPPREPIHRVWQRLKAKKGLKHHGVNRDEVSKQIALLARSRKKSAKAILVFVRTIDDVKTVQQILTDKKEGLPNDQVQVLTGTLRGWERDKLAKDDPIFARFLLKAPPDGRTVYLVCTSAGEVGIDISADHMVCDLTPLDSMTQRLGRVNRRGDSAAEVDVVFESDRDPKPRSPDFEKARWKTKEILERLPKCDWLPAKDRQEASPFQLHNLNLSNDERKAAFAPEPTILPATDILFDVWALTTISPPLVRTPLPGRPAVEAYLHGISDWQPPETSVTWREEVEVITGVLLDRYKPEDLLADYPLKPHELLRDRTNRVFKELQAIRQRMGDNTAIWIEEDRGQVEVTTLGKLLDADEKTVVNRIAYCRLLLPPFAGGLTDKGMLDGTLDFDPNHNIEYDIADKWFADEKKTVPRRVRIRNGDPKNAPPRGMRLVRAPLDTNPPADEDETDEPINQRFWHWYELPKSADDEGSKSAQEPVTWDDHTNQVTNNAIRITAALRLPQELQDAITLAAKFHDLGKKRERWQRSIGNPNPKDWYAKSGKGWKLREINTPYRHEFGSLLDALDLEQSFTSQLNTLSTDMQELVLHLIAAHHGRGRPHFPIDEAVDLEPKGQDVTKIVAEVPQRFGRLQRKYGRWGLAYLESLLRAADYAASAKPSQTKDQP
jgi:CRISPR-associated endonuclease/helicase Cas3